MFSKFLSTSLMRKFGGRCLILLGKKQVDQKQKRYFQLVPRSHYDVPIPNRLNLALAMREYWEIAPVILITVFALSCMFGSIIWAIWNKVDAVYTTHNRENISRTMNLRYPTKHKLIVINQKYEPWPEMQDVLDKMVFAEKRAKARLGSCDNP